MVPPARPDLSVPALSVDLGSRPPPVGRLVGDLWRSRRLAAMLARKDFYVRYRRASFGLLWALLLPLWQAVVLAFVFSRIVRFEVGVSYTLFIYSGMIVWGFFSIALTAAATSIVDGAGLSTKIYFPRAVLPVASVMSNLYGFLLSIGLLIAMCPFYDVSLGPELILLVPAVALAMALTVSLALVLAAVHVYARDMRFIVDAAQRAWFYLTPVFYPLDRFPDFRAWLAVNPATGMVELFRAATVGAADGWVTAVYWSLAWVVVLTLLAGWLHRRHDRVFVDLL